LSVLYCLFTYSLFSG